MNHASTTSTASASGSRSDGRALPAVKRLVRQIADAEGGRRCLLAVCPNSRAVARAALRAAKAAHAPILFAATLNQVDVDGGYTGWTPHALVGFLTSEAERIGLQTSVLPCLDHGGPWLKDRHRAEGLAYDEAMAAVKRSLEACLEAGYALLHIDPTVDPTLLDEAPIPIERVVERTLELVAHAEAYRQQRGLPPISYEVGTEEVHGGLADMDTFHAFLAGLDAGLKRLGLEEAWPSFVVGKVGTDLDTDTFDPEVARRLTQAVAPYGALIKGHYTDGVANPEDYPLSGMGGANVGPELTEVEYEALVELVRLEKKIGADSGLERALREAVVASGRWKKWLRPDERGRPFDALGGGRQRWLARTGCRYIWTSPEVVEARERLYHNVRDVRAADAFVLWRIQRSIMAYLHAFNLVGAGEALG